MTVENRDRLILTSVLLLVKAVLLVALGPAMLPDTSGYVAFADQILAGRLDDAGLTASAMPVTLFRVIGFPMVIAILKLAGGDAWPWLLVVVQSAVSLAATLSVHTVARHMGLGRWPSLGVAAALALSLPLVHDQAVLSDSLYASLVTILMCILLRPWLCNQGLTPARMALAGTLLAFAFLFREATTYLTVGILPLVVLAALAGTTRRWGRAVMMTLLFLAPLIVVQQGYREWNRGRIGVPVVTTGSQSNMIFSVSKAARQDPSVLDGDSLMFRVARATFRTYDFEESIQVNNTLFRDHGMNAVAMAQAGYDAYFSAWRHHFSAMVRVPLGHLRGNQAQLTVRPVESLRELILWTQGDDGGFARWQSVKQGRWWMAPLVMVDGASKAVAIVIFAAFALLAPLRLARDGWGDRVAAAGMALWLFYFAVLGIYALVHLETRYMAPVLAASLLVGTANLIWAVHWWKRRRRDALNPV